jgi:predicted metalloprotease
MRWQQSRQSRNVEDRRGQRMAGGAKIGGGAGLLIIVVVLLLGGDPRQVLQLLGGGSPQISAPSSAPTGPPSDEAGRFLTSVLGMTEDVWTSIFANAGARYAPPTLVLFTQSVQSACGFNTAATGPFYCPPDQKLYLDTSFFDQLAQMGGPGDFAQAYVIGHEVGHHIQNLTGTDDWVRQLQRGGDEATNNRLQVLMELQADCYAGVWAHHANRLGNVLDPGDVEEGLSAAAAIGDDRLQRRAGREVAPESFTHGTSAQRQRWLQIGIETGEVDRCDTFGEAGLVRSR